MIASAPFCTIVGSVIFLNLDYKTQVLPRPQHASMLEINTRHLHILFGMFRPTHVSATEENGSVA